MHAHSLYFITDYSCMSDFSRSPHVFSYVFNIIHNKFHSSFWKESSTVVPKLLRVVRT